MQSPEGVGFDIGSAAGLMQLYDAVKDQKGQSRFGSENRLLFNNNFLH